MLNNDLIETNKLLTELSNELIISLSATKLSLLISKLKNHLNMHLDEMKNSSTNEMNHSEIIKEIFLLLKILNHNEIFTIEIFKNAVNKHQIFFEIFARTNNKSYDKYWTTGKTVTAALNNFMLKLLEEL